MVEEEEVEEIEEIEELEEEEERKRMRKNKCDILCLNNFSKCRLATYVGLTSIETITFIDLRKINTTLHFANDFCANDFWTAVFYGGDRT